MIKKFKDEKRYNVKCYKISLFKMTITKSNKIIFLFLYYNSGYLIFNLSVLILFPKGN